MQIGGTQTNTELSTVSVNTERQMHLCSYWAICDGSLRAHVNVPVAVTELRRPKPVTSPLNMSFSLLWVLLASGTISVSPLVFLIRLGNVLLKFSKIINMASQRTHSFTYIFILCTYVHMCTWCPWKSEEVTGSPGTLVYDSCE